MKYTSLPLLALLLCALGFHGCKEETPQELILNTWKMTDMIPPPNLQFSEKFIQDFETTFTIEFKADSSYTHSLKGETQTGTYAMSPDGKIITYNINETGKSFVDTVLELTKTRLSVVEENGIKKIYKR